jgi:hypothetical protein
MSNARSGTDAAAGSLSPAVPAGERRRRLLLAPVIRRAVSRAAVGAAGPAAAGVVVAVAALLQEPVIGPVRLTVLTLILLPAVLVHCHNRAERYRLNWAEHLAAALVGGLASLLLIVVGLFGGAAIVLVAVLAAQTGVLAGAAQISGVASLAIALRRSRQRA